MSQPEYQVTNPATGAVSQRFPFANDAEVANVLSTAHAASGDWRERPVAERAAVARRVAELFDERRATLAALIAEEMGKATGEGDGEVSFCVDIFSYYGEHAAELLAPRDVAGRPTAQVEYLPIGTVLGVMPWNYPYYQVARLAAPNLVAGNTVVIKHAENCPTSAVAIAEIMADAGVPEGVYANVFATHEQVATMIADPRVRGVSLTGSERAGAAVASAAGRHLKPVVLELGGSDPYIVLDTPDADATAEAAWAFRIENVGQACNSNKRMIVMDDVFDDFVAGLTRRAGAMRPRISDTGGAGEYSPMVSRRAAEALAEQVQDAVDNGAVVHTGAVLADGPGAYYAPTVLTGVTPEMRAFHEELFGPVAVVYRVSSDDEAVDLANAVEFGLGGSVWSSDEERASRVAARLDVGMINVNTAACEAADVPFGGTKRSGFGRELGALGIEGFLNKRLRYVERS